MNMRLQAAVSGRFTNIPFYDGYRKRSDLVVDKQSKLLTLSKIPILRLSWNDAVTHAHKT